MASGIPQQESEFIELFYRYKKYRVRKSDFDDKRNKVVILPNGIALDLTQMAVDTTDKHGNKLEHPCFFGTNSDYEVWGELPVIGIVRVEEVK